jgi:hypothetical protein
VSSDVSAATMIAVVIQQKNPIVATSRDHANSRDRL